MVPPGCPAETNPNLCGLDPEEVMDQLSNGLQEISIPNPKNKKKKRNRKKGNKGEAQAEPSEDTPRVLKTQTDPPSVPVDEIFDTFPQGQILDYSHVDHLFRKSDENKKVLENIQFDVYNDIRRAAEVHRQVRAYMRSVIKPGMTMIDIW
ncbi:Methionine aminopeptidase 2A [Thelohanellus kitauei]|uniref:Methionine aminopeptidase 2A n=1 Tax=Thelohanellus kitauei TaxID=669202 RepID=A0A0C2II75_THEKT|nr:Methionine aminopeptidase 2A [Thelohanellus kitauei]